MGCRQQDQTKRKELLHTQGCNAPQTVKGLVLATINGTSCSLLTQSRESDVMTAATF
jgi:hypothetical protein